MPNGRRRLWVVALVALAALLPAAPARAQGTALQDPLLDRMAGQWVLRGTIAGQQTAHDVTAEWVLGHGYLRLHEVSRERGPDGGPAYEAIVFIGRNPEGEGYACLWLDSTGDGGLLRQAIGHAPPAADGRIAFVFVDPDGGRFHTTFVHDPSAGSWRWVMDGEGEGGTLKPFARVTLTRAPPGDRP